MKSLLAHAVVLSALGLHTSCGSDKSTSPKPDPTQALQNTIDDLEKRLHEAGQAGATATVSSTTALLCKELSNQVAELEKSRASKQQTFEEKKGAEAQKIEELRQRHSFLTKTSIPEVEQAIHDSEKTLVDVQKRAPQSWEASEQIQLIQTQKNLLNRLQIEAEDLRQTIVNWDRASSLRPSLDGEGNILGWSRDLNGLHKEISRLDMELAQKREALNKAQHLKEEAARLEASLK